MRDYADVHQLTVLANLENYNSILIKEEVGKEDRLKKLREQSIIQLQSLRKTSHTIGSVESPFVLMEQDSKLSKVDKNVKTVVEYKPKKE